ncbi:ABC transporter ATP-binding protein [Sinomonas sp. ASV322]|uniref:ABC transporter ATP-binding protein n=1 Tax=Sinomonas sp. ASV322 TaxID=3041920 RepID=UPI0027DCDBEA|nr:ABC transporter ATP-binding protein [Sinomonas sp. ASV322]MDQ4501471.1 ABC transporter ATP-binding protein [Sinomonas sp. ASV322]
MGRLVLNQLSRSFKDVKAVDNISLVVEDGDFLVLLGPSGCGKTTLLRMIAGLLDPTSGTLELDDRDITDVPSRRRDLAMVFQSYALYPHLSVAKNLAFPLSVRGADRRKVAARVAEVADMVEIGHLLDRKPKELSGGQRQRVAVARALVRHPKAFLMDEPLSNLDAKLRTATRQELAALHRRLGATFIYVTHDQIEAMTMATKIALLNGGRLEQVGTPDELYDKPASVFAAGFMGSPATNLIDARLASRDGKITVTAPDVEAALWEGETPEREIVLGIRPEHLVLEELDARSFIEPAAADAALRGVVELSENLGREQLVHCRVGELRITAMCPREQRWEAGTAVVLAARAEHLHLFDRASGRRLEWQAEPTLASAPAANDDAAHSSGRRAAVVPA